MKTVQRSIILFPLLLLLLGMFSYFPSFFGQMFWDDDDFILNNVYVKNFQITKFFTTQAVEGAGKSSNYFRPIQFTLYSVLYNIFSSHPLPYKTLSILLHCSAAITAYLFLNTLLKRQDIAFFIAALFLIHPVQTEAVSYVSGLSDPLVSFFGFLTLYLFLLYPSGKIPIVSIGAFICALLSKEIGVVFGGILVVLWVYQMAHHKKISFSLLTHNFLTSVFPFIACIGIYLFYHLTVIHSIDMKSVWGNHPYTFSPVIRIATFFTLLPGYLSVILFPFHLFYDRDFSVTVLSTVWNVQAFFIGFLLFLSAGLLVIYSFRYKQYLVLFFALSAAIAFLPYSGIILINGIMYEHFVYVPLLFVITALVMLFKHLLSRTNISEKTLIFCVVLIFPLLLLRSWIRQIDWNDPVRLYNHTLTYVPNSFRVRNNLASEYQRLGLKNLAIEQYNKAIELQPNIPNPYHNLGNLYLKEGDYKTARMYFQKALEVDPSFEFSRRALQSLEEVSTE